jgi:hypothetical protein
MYRFVRSTRGFLRVETSSILIADCDLDPIENNSDAYEDYLIRVIEKASKGFGLLSRIYRTNKGLRVIVCNKLIKVKNSIGFLHAINTDSIYIGLCMRDNVFSARLSPKPYRVGASRSQYLDYPKESPQKEEWFEQYEEACKNYATCKFKHATSEHLPVDAYIEEFIEMHDTKTRAFEDLPIA